MELRRIVLGYRCQWFRQLDDFILAKAIGEARGATIRKSAETATERRSI